MDLEGQGLTTGFRVNNLSIERFHNQISSLILSASPDLPCFLSGHGIGGLAVNSFLGCNPDIANRLAGVMYSSPMFGHFNRQSYLEKLLYSFMAYTANEIVLLEAIPVHRLSRSKIFQRALITQQKTVPLMTASLMASVNRNISRGLRFAQNVTYPYLVVTGGRDTMVDNKKTERWHRMTRSEIKELKVMPECFHELCKEPNNDEYFEIMLKFIDRRLAHPVKFGQVAAADIRKI